MKFITPRLTPILLSGFVFLLSGCASIPGKNRQEQIQTIDSLVDRTLKDLYKQSPAAEEEIKQSAGYLIMNNKITKIPVVGAGGGYGVAINNKTSERTYMRMGRFDFGAGWGARSVRPVAIFDSEKKFAELIDGKFEMQFGVEASAKVGEAGAAGGAGGGTAKGKDRGYKLYFITDAGVSATAALGFIRVKPIKLKKK